MKGSYQLLEAVCGRFPELLKLYTRVDTNIIGIAVFSAENYLILEKREDVIFDMFDVERIEELKDQYAYDILCSSVLLTASTMKKKIDEAKSHHPQLN